MKIIRINSNKKHLLTLQENHYIQITKAEKKILLNDQVNISDNSLFTMPDKIVT